MKKLRQILLPLLVFFSVCLAAQTVPPSLDSLLNRTLDSMLTVVNAKGFGGAMQLPNGAVWANGAGISSANPLEEVGDDHAFNIGSITKTITAACILQLADEGLLSLDDSLHEWLPTFQYINPNITIRQLLRHQTGLYDVITNPSAQPLWLQKPDSLWLPQDVIKSFIKPQLFQPGAAFSYSNTNYLLLGLIIEAVSDQPYYQEIRDRFLTPLNLTSMSAPPLEPAPPTVAHLWIDLNGDGQVEDDHEFFSNWYSFATSGGPAGIYYSTPSDLARWMRAYMSGTLLSPAMMAQLKTTVTTPFNGGTRYGLGIMERNFQTYKGFGHGGDAGYSASAWYFPVKDVSIAVLNNDGRRNSWTLAPVVLALLKTYIKWETSTVAAPEAVANATLPLQVAPNPFSNELSITVKVPSGGGDMQVILTNALGEKVAGERLPELPAGEHAFQLTSLQHLPAGLYFTTLLLDGRAAGTTRIVKN